MRILFLNKAPRKLGTYDASRIEALLNSYASPGTKVVLDFPDDFAGSEIKTALGGQRVLNGLDHQMDTPSLIRKIVWAADNGYDAVIQSNTFDPGVEGARLAVDIPVLGPLRTTLHAAAILTDRLGILVPLDTHVPLTWRLLRSYGMDRLVTNVLPITLYCSDKEGEGENLRDAAAERIVQLAETGAQGVIPLGGVVIPYIVNPAELERMTGVPVWNTKAVTIRFAETCVGLGLRQSPLAYPKAKLTLSDFG
jgi:allantoin racemase